ncbi:hypothetical protein [Borrelia persica]|uniref:hypothetical protein n=1 Tax=Borrelia persica TaxID=44448 RepID=UPI00046568FF|nr:hypothetical protein [Borrelia persica]
MQVFRLLFVLGVLNLFIGCSTEPGSGGRVQKDSATSTEGYLGDVFPDLSGYDSYLPTTSFNFDESDFVRYEVYSGHIDLHSLLEKNSKSLVIVRIDTANHIHNKLLGMIKDFVSNLDEERYEFLGSRSKYFNYGNNLLNKLYLASGVMVKHIHVDGIERDIIDSSLDLLYLALGYNKVPVSNFHRILINLFGDVSDADLVLNESTAVIRDLIVKLLEGGDTISKLLNGSFSAEAINKFSKESEFLKLDIAKGELTKFNDFKENYVKQLEVLDSDLREILILLIASKREPVYYYDSKVKALSMLKNLIRKEQMFINAIKLWM